MSVDLLDLDTARQQAIRLGAGWAEIRGRTLVVGVRSGTRSAEIRFDPSALERRAFSNRVQELVRSVQEPPA